MANGAEIGQHYPVLRLRDNISAEARRFGQEISEDLRRYNLEPLAVLQGGTVYADVYAPSSDTPDVTNRPFVVLKVRNDTDSARSYVYKTISSGDEDVERKMRNEAAFVARLAPLIQEVIPDSRQNKIMMPGSFIAEENTGRSIIVEEFLEGNPIGGVHETYPEVTEDDVFAIADFIHGFGTLSLDTVRRTAPAVKLKQSRAEGYRPNFDKWRGKLTDVLGYTSVSTAEELLEDSSDLVEGLPERFAAIDINPSNILKDTLGRLGMIDWERIAITRNPAFDYNFMYATLWQFPDLQEKYLRYVLQSNSDVPRFKDYMRVDFIFNRGFGELAYWYDIAYDKNRSTVDREKARQAIDSLKGLVTDAIDKRGSWADEEIAGQVFPPSSETSGQHRERQPIRTQEALLDAIPEVTARGERLAVILDFDKTTSAARTADPRLTEFHPGSAQAIAEIQRKGHYPAILTDRSGIAVAKLLASQGVTGVPVSGIKGMEFVLPTSPDPRDWIVQIDERFRSYSGVITGGLETVENALLETLGMRPLTISGEDIEIPTPGGPVVIERKGTNAEFPMGLANSYNFNLVAPDVRGQLVRVLQQKFSEFMAQVPDREAVQRLWGQTSSTNSPLEEGRFSLAFEPIIESGKSEGLLKLLEKIQNGPDFSSRIGLIIAADDRDPGAMIKGQELEMTSLQHDPNPLRFVGIGVRSNRDEPEIETKSDLLVGGVDELAGLLTKIADKL